MVNAMVAQLPWHSRAQDFTAMACAPASPTLAPPLVVNDITDIFKIASKPIGCFPPQIRF